jgi:hypothetical protein
MIGSGTCSSVCNLLIPRNFPISEVSRNGVVHHTIGTATLFLEKGGDRFMLTGPCSCRHVLQECHFDGYVKLSNSNTRFPVKEDEAGILLIHHSINKLLTGKKIRIL